MLIVIAKNTILDTSTFKVWYSDTGTYLRFTDLDEILEKNSKWIVPTLDNFYEISTKISEHGIETFNEIENELKFDDAIGFITAHRQIFIYAANFLNTYKVRNCELRDKYRIMLWRHLEDDEFPTIFIQKERFEFF